LIGQADWQAESQRCPGIQLIPNTVVNGTPESAVMKGEEVVKEMVLYEVHKGGLGPNWNYDEASELLSLSESTTPLIEEYKNKFLNDYRSEIQYETDSLCIVDTTIPVSSFQSDDVIDDDDTVLDTSSQIDQTSSKISVEPTRITHRRLEFKSNQNVVQSEARLLPTGLIDYSLLVAPVYRVLAQLALGHFRDFSNSFVRIGVIGAGGCVLPNYVYRRLKKDKPDLTVHIDCVDLDAEVLQIAEAYFDTQFTLPSSSTGTKQVTLLSDEISGLFKHNMEGSAFMETQLESIFSYSSDDEEVRNIFEYDVIVLDACGLINKGSSSDSNSNSDNNNENDNNTDNRDDSDSSADVFELSLGNDLSKSKSRLYNRRKHFFKSPCNKKLKKTLRTRISSRKNISIDNNKNNDDESNSHDSNLVEENVWKTPPPSLLHRVDLFLACLRPSNGMLLVNVYGDRQWLRHVYRMLARVAEMQEVPLPDVYVINQNNHASSNHYKYDGITKESSDYTKLARRHVLRMHDLLDDDDRHQQQNNYVISMSSTTRNLN
jgi:hypothetical protein